LAYNRRLNYFNEAILLATGYHLFCFTDFVPRAADRYEVGQSLIFFIIFTIFVNLSTVALPAVLAVKKRLQFLYVRH
jgi:hypothetical protein